MLTLLTMIMFLLIGGLALAFLAPILLIPAAFIITVLIGMCRTNAGIFILVSVSLLCMLIFG